MRKSSYARHLLRQPPLECDSTPSKGFLAAVRLSAFSLIKRVFRDAHTSDDEANKQIVELEREIVELRKANEILKDALGFFAKDRKK